jgi:hypothetical protein
MDIRKGLVISSLLPSLGGLDYAEAGCARKLANTHNLSLSYTAGAIERNLRGEPLDGAPDTLREVGWEL